ncbi:hypothetical protein H012_gp709 [Acanthamoeba polyphaga moumouvirus]|uniref:Uncharacterized protein n=1 Tax=Acanthamoeba polyphaga moumouvirus TaxID=1269028 RepID=L7RC27_9VIRU|nr:hypothetical protein H012_gp709 [Acanthamoeba polyphaga moumouvirus]AGC01756.1 hypothetical protein Moumou_00212 [Acanthamoeba polyphaga moumouvirus]AQN68103.1 hypothetical protein [Saudi moumouvirus]
MQEHDCNNINYYPNNENIHECEIISDYNNSEVDQNCDTEISSNLKTIGGKHYVKPRYTKFIVTDEYLLDYLLKKYRLEKNKLIHTIQEQKKREYKSMIIEFFYKENVNVKYKNIKEQYKILKKWNESGLEISFEDLDNFFEEKIKNYL